MGLVYVVEGLLGSSGLTLVLEYHAAVLFH